MTIRVLVTYFFTAFREVRWYSYNLARENPLFWLATRAGNIGPICPYGIHTLIPRKKKIFFQCNQLFFFLNLNLNLFLNIILTYVLTLYLLLTRFLPYINLHYLQYIYDNTITQVKLNYSWSICVIVCTLIVRVTNKNFVC